MNPKGLVIPLVLWVILTVVYGVALFVFRNYEVLSLIYHVGLLAVALWCAKGMLRNELGLRIGNFCYGVLICIGFAGALVIRSLIVGWPQFDLAFDLTTFSTIIFAPITEEIFWQGLIQQRMQTTKLDPLYVIIVNAALFASMHIPKLLFFGSSPIEFIAIMGLGIIFSATFYLTKSVYYSTTLHIIENIFAI